MGELSISNKMVNQLPEKWCIKVTSDNIELIGGYYNRRGSTAYTQRNCIGEYLTSHNMGNGRSIMDASIDYGAYFMLARPTAAFPEITFEQFKEHVLGIKDKKIIGYKAPYDLCSGAVKKDHKYVKYGSGSYYKPDTIQGSHLELPAEIVEKWEPVYEEEYKVGDWITVIAVKHPHHWLNGTTIRTFQLVQTPTEFSFGLGWSTSGIDNNTEKGRSGIPQEWFRKATTEEIESASTIKLTVGSRAAEVVVSKGSIKTRGTDISYPTLKALYNDFVAQQDRVFGASWKVYIDQGTRIIRIGCDSENNKFSLKDIKEVLDAYQKLN